ncbi:MAG: hypothetical protein ACPG31_07725 [Planctomycetota bacterium]
MRTLLLPLLLLCSCQQAAWGEVSTSLSFQAAPTKAQWQTLMEMEHVTELSIWDDGEMRLDPPIGEPVDDEDLLQYISHLHDLESLVLGGWNMKVTDAGLWHLHTLGELRHLSLCQVQGISDEGMQALALLPALESLDLTYTDITDRGLETLAQIPTMRTIRYAWTARHASYRQEFLRRNPQAAYLLDSP